MVQDWTRDSFPRHPTFQPQYYPADGTTARHQSFSSERYASDVVQRHHSFPQERVGVEADNARFQEGTDSRRPPLMQIDEALRTHCGIVAKHYFVAAINEDGASMTFFSPSPGRGMTDNTIRQFFDASRYRQVMSRIDAGADPMLDDYNLEDSFYNRPAAFNRSRMIDGRRRNSGFGDWSGSPIRQGRKRVRGTRAVNDEDDVPMTVSSRRGIRIGDPHAVWSFYEQRFKNCQQTACKLIAKAWVKAVEPKKQSTHPYTGSDEKAPAWWPKPWGPTKDDKVRHKEPDHLYKRAERVHLLAHILRLVVEPNAKQHPDIQKLGLNVKKLEETTVEALSSFFMDNEANAKKRPFLNEIFKVARQEERYKNGEIDGTTEVYVMAEDKMPESYASDNEEATYIKDEDDHEARSKPLAAQCLPHPAGSEPSSATSIRPPTFINDMTVRANAFPPSMITELPAQPHTYVEGGTMSVHSSQPVATTAATNIALDMVPSPHDASRRPSVFSDYASPGGMYSQQWPQASTNTNASTMYPYAQQQTTTQSASFVGSGVSMTSNQTFIPNSFETPHRNEYDQTGAPIFRSGDLSQAPPVTQQQGYGYTMSNDTRGMRVMTQVVDAAGHRPSLQ
ncbi:hypothetical protein N5P37_007880 [Trichoderma harzianum]|uniref:Subtelomeric hrmA-associated cluster protein AFUB-079030/YDR124W-like helical bundle domain-containing protein n=1 Tax=Trichoderma harzianum CBS 226.95 TaxID=983964 RepID=A0A2T4A3S5_TRIHA|nr:hypothetical protein M431DRAFT_92636 [Trichoderma harzianum CBS 226.95]KAK0759692.1 hypothetical protein N5P37_007880 [Trichoderma harzianum]PTB51727.1 hypothetical protein M431DRAFT_92636 [Trichoderma harzianum CBS 226.95]